MTAMILVLLFAMPNREWIMSAFDLSPSPDAERLILALRMTLTELADRVDMTLANLSILKTGQGARPSPVRAGARRT